MPSSPTVGIYTLGCKVNQYESEAFAEAFAARGFSVRDIGEACDVYVINTCTVTAESDRKAGQFIRRARGKNPAAYLLVTGCLAQTDPERVRRIPGVDFVCGNTEKLSVVAAAEALLAAGQKPASAEIRVDELTHAPFEPMTITRFDRTRAYVKIEDGCESACTYCIIPRARGPIRSKAPADVLREVEALTKGGCREVVLTGIETASYGRDFSCAYRLGDLLTDIDAIDGIGRVRLGSLDPSLITDAFAEQIAPLASLAPHFHLSMQSGCDRILSAMKRKYNTRMALAAMERLRRVLPDVMFTTDMITGFPSETEEDFRATLDFVREAEFLMIHAFSYSRRTGTAAATLPDQVPEPIKHARTARLIAESEKSRAAILSRCLGRTYPVLFETYADGVAYGHTPNFLEVALPTPHSLTDTEADVRLLTHDGKRCHGELC